MAGLTKHAVVETVNDDSLRRVSRCFNRNEQKKRKETSNDEHTDNMTGVKNNL